MRATAGAFIPEGPADVANPEFVFWQIFVLDRSRASMVMPQLFPEAQGAVIRRGLRIKTEFALSPKSKNWVPAAPFLECPLTAHICYLSDTERLHREGNEVQA